MISFLDSENSPNIPIEKEENLLSSNPEIAKYYGSLNENLEELFIMIIQEG